MRFEFFVTHCLFNDDRGPGQRQWTLVLRAGAITPGGGEISVYSANPVPVGHEFVLIPAAELAAAG